MHGCNSNQEKPRQKVHEFEASHSETLSQKVNKSLSWFELEVNLAVVLQLTLMQLEETNTQKTDDLAVMIPVVAVTA